MGVDTFSFAKNPSHPDRDRLGSDSTDEEQRARNTQNLANPRYFLPAICQMHQVYPVNLRRLDESAESLALLGNPSISQETAQQQMAVDDSVPNAGGSTRGLSSAHEASGSG